MRQPLTAIADVELRIILLEATQRTNHKQPYLDRTGRGRQNKTEH
jgi:hypothetical protein